MARDYKNRSTPAPKRRTANQGLPRWAFALVGFGLGLCVAVGTYTEGRYPGTIFASNDAEPVPLADSKAAVEVADTRQPNYTFYSLLPEMEVNVPPREVVEKRRGPQAPKPAVIKPTITKPKPKMTEAERVARILAGAESARPAAVEPRSRRAVVPAPLRSVPDTGNQVALFKPSAPIPGAYMVQVGSFREISDADRLKASLAMSGHRATIQTARMADESQRHRVRLGPFDSAESAKRVSVGLADGGRRPLLIKIES